MSENMLCSFGFRERNQVKLHSAHYDITRIKALLYTLCVCNVS
jgi:hypothetical protein